MIFKQIKYFHFFILFVASSFLWSCHDDESASTPFTVNLATANTIDSESSSYYFTLDDGSTLLPKTSLSKFSFKDGQRVFLNYTTLTNTVENFDYEIEINNISEILTKNIISRSLTTEENESLGNDPVKIISLWVGDNYLNFRFKILIGGEGIKHDIDLVLTESCNDSLFLAFRHNANRDTERFEELSYAAFDLRSLRESLSEKTTLVVETSDFENKQKSYTLNYKNNGNSSTDNFSDNESANNSLIK